jgi:hypothetical protein
MPPTVETQTDRRAWKVESFRLTAFTNASAAADADRWWTEVAVAPAESKTQRMQGAVVSMEGHFGAGRLVLNIDLSRVDWINIVEVSLDHEFAEVPNMGFFADLNGQFKEVMHRWLVLNPKLPIARLAWGAVLVLPVQSRVAGYDTLQAFLPSLTIDSAGSSELLYQINRSRISHVIPGLSINRLQKWSVTKLQRFGMAVAGGGSIQANIGMGAEGCRLELDINSSPEYPGLIPAEFYGPLLEEFVLLGTEIAEQGDVP